MATMNVAVSTDFNSNSIPAIWQKAVLHVADRMSISNRLVGSESSDAPIVEKEDLSKQPGDTIRYVIYNRLIGKVKTGTTALQNTEEKMTNAADSVTVALFRHATAFDKYAAKVVLGDLEAVAARNVGEWLARFLDDEFTDQVLNQDTPTILYGGDATTRAQLGPGDTLSASAFKRLHAAAQRRGVKEWQTSGKARMPFPVYGAIVNEIDAYNLANSDGFVQDFRLAANRGKDNPVLDGNLDMYNGVVIYRWSSVNPGDGMLGSFLRPEARLAATITSSGLTITAGPTSAVTNVDYWQYFPTSGTNTLKIDEEQISYTATPGDSSLTVATRGANGTTQAAHTAGALITLNNVGKVILFGRHTAMRAWAQRPQRIKQDYDYDYERGRGIDFIYEVKGIEAADGTLANCVVGEFYSPNPSTI